MILTERRFPEQGRSVSPADSTSEVTLLLAAFRRGEPDAAAKLMPLVYDELHRLAVHYMRQEQPGNTLQPTALVNEAYLRLVAQNEVTWQGRTHFIGFAAQVMRHYLIDQARRRRAARHGGLNQKVDFEKAIVISRDQSDELLSIHEALERLEKLDARQARVVELRYFGGLSLEETAGLLSLSTKTVKRDWASARVWLHREISGRVDLK
jgi:RNA polymerase sigma-70 factor (ECF subfamily)